MVANRNSAVAAHTRNDTRMRLISAGTEILSEKGFASTGIEEVLSKAGVPRGSFYYYFDSKVAFGLAVIENYEYIWDQKLTRLLRDPAIAPLDRIDNYISESMRGLEKYAFRRGCLIGNLGQEMASMDELFRTRVFEVFTSWAKYIADCLDDAKRHGSLSDDANVEQIARFFWFAWEGAILQAKLEQSVQPVQEFRAVLFKLILGRP